VLQILFPGRIHDLNTFLNLRIYLRMDISKKDSMLEYREETRTREKSVSQG
jgi:hypothetical protein